MLLHGFAESGERLFRKLEAALPEPILDHALVIAPNGPFPMPHKTESGYSVTFAWYFYDPGAGEYYIDMRPAIDFIKTGIRVHGAWDLPKRVIGFSQGGYLALLLAAELPAMKQLIGIGCEYLVDEIPGNPPANVPYRVDHVHGSADESVKAEEARLSHQRLIDAGVNGQLELIDGATHRIDHAIRVAVRTALLRV